MGGWVWGTLSGERGVGGTGVSEEDDRQDVGGPERVGQRADGDLPTAHLPPTTAPTNPNLALGLDLLSPAPVASHLISSTTHGGMDHHHAHFRDGDTESQRVKSGV